MPELDDPSSRLPAWRKGSSTSGMARVLRQLGADRLKGECETALSRLGEPLDLAMLTDGVVHRVVRIRGPAGSVVIKQRLDHCAGLPHIAIDPAAIADERRAYEVIGSAAPGITPRIFGFDREHYLIVMEDVGVGRLPLLMALCDERADAARVAGEVGRTTARLHVALAPMPHPLRPDGDAAFSRRNLFERITFQGVRTAPIAESIVALDAQLIFGDLSPKNILVGYDDVRLVDLEHVHRGAPVFDVAFLAAHLALARWDCRKDDVAAVTNAAVDSYTSIASLDGSDLLGALVICLLLYRLRNDIVPYRLASSAQRRADAVARLDALIGLRGLTLWDAVHALTGGSR